MNVPIPYKEIRVVEKQRVKISKQFPNEDCHVKQVTLESVLAQLRNHQPLRCVIINRYNLLICCVTSALKLEKRIVFVCFVHFLFGFRGNWTYTWTSSEPDNFQQKWFVPHPSPSVQATIRCFGIFCQHHDHVDDYEILALNQESIYRGNGN